MKFLKSLSLHCEDNQLFILDQTQLPQSKVWVPCESPQKMCDIIKKLQVRGAPLIGVAAAIALGLYAEKGASKDEIERAAESLIASRPTAVNLAYCINKQMHAYKNNLSPQTLVAIAEELFFEDKELCEKIANAGASLISNGDNILTHCNTGPLVTTGIGTALGIIISAHQNGKNIHVYADETRPLLQGRLTTWELMQNNVPVTLICDSMAASLMQDKKIQKIFVGADRISRNGDFANKIGTYSLAVLAKHHDIPFYVAAPYTTLDLNCQSGADIKIEQRDANEVRGFKETIWSPENCDVYNPAFDVTPGALVTKFILDTGLYTANELKNLNIKQKGIETCPGQ